MELYSQSNSPDRNPVAAGSFYPSDKEILTKDIFTLFKECIKPQKYWNIRAIIVPHAGYIYSGKTAAAGFSTTRKDAEYKNIFLIGSSHVMSFNGASVYSSGDFITPLGKAVVNKQIANTLKSENKVLNFPESAHIKDHCLEVEIPFIQNYYEKPVPVIPIIIGTNDVKTIKAIAEALRPYFTDENLFVFSSDFSHYPSYDEAKRIDNLTAKALISGNPDKFLNTLSSNASENVPGLLTSMCGWTSGLVMLYLAGNDKNLEIVKVDYSNSGDLPGGNKNEVVGYNAIVLREKENQEKNKKNVSSEFSFTEKEKQLLFSIAHNAIESMLNIKPSANIDPVVMPEALKKCFGAFVTLKINGDLRGCIGRFYSSDPLYEVVKQSAISSAFEDTRFSPLTLREYPRTDFEITVIGPLKKINNINEIILGKHGIYIKKDLNAGTMLPQVAIENNWTVEEFLSYTSMYKAGIGRDGWKNAEIYIYEGLVLEENK